MCPLLRPGVDSLFYFLCSVSSASAFQKSFHFPYLLWNACWSLFYLGFLLSLPPVYLAYWWAFHVPLCAQDTSPSLLQCCSFLVISAPFKSPGIIFFFSSHSFVIRISLFLHLFSLVYKRMFERVGKDQRPEWIPANYMNFESQSDQFKGTLGYVFLKCLTIYQYFSVFFTADTQYLI